MNFGHIDANKGNIITTPDTPCCMDLHLGSQDFFTLISNTCSGYSFYKMQSCSITRYATITSR